MGEAHTTHNKAQKSDNLQYNTLLPWVAGTNDSSTKCLMFPSIIPFFIISCKTICKNCLNLFIYFFFSKFTKINTKRFECPKSIRNYEKNNACNIRRLVDESFVPATQQMSALYCRLS